MTRLPAASFSLSILCLLILGATEPVAAQSSSRGFANFELNRINRDAVGIGFSIDDINRRTLARSRARIAPVGVASVDGRSRAGFGATSPRAPSLGLNTSRSSSRPFSNLNRRPTVSPWLALERASFDPDQTSLDYQTIVRPQLRQREQNQRMEREVQAFNARLQNIAAQPAFNPQGSQNFAPTGSPSTFRYYSHYYPGAR